MSPAKKKNPYQVVGDLFLKLINRASHQPETMTEAELILFRVWLLVGEVSNGGFDQYFSNSSGNGARFALGALKTIGDPKAADILDRAMKVFPKPPEADRVLRWRQLQKMTKARRKKFDALDRELWDRSTAVVEKLAAYVEANRKQIKPRKEKGGRRYT